MTYNVFGGTLSLTLSVIVTLSQKCPFYATKNCYHSVLRYCCLISALSFAVVFCVTAFAT